MTTRRLYPLVGDSPHDMAIASVDTANKWSTVVIFDWADTEIRVGPGTDVGAIERRLTELQKGEM